MPSRVIITPTAQGPQLRETHTCLPPGCDNEDRSRTLRKVNLAAGVDGHGGPLLGQLAKALPADVERGTVPGLKAALEEFRGAKYLAPFGALRDDGRATGAVSEYQIFRAWTAFLESGTFRKKQRDKPLGPLPRGRSSSRDSSPERGGGERPRAVDRSPEGRTRSASRDPFTPAWVRMSTTDACDEFALSREGMLARSPSTLLHP